MHAKTRGVVKMVQGLASLAILALAASALSNLGLPARSQVVEHLGDAEKARLAELFHLRQQLGDAVWPGWGQADIPLIVYNEAYAFLVGYPGPPPPGWLKMPQRSPRGSPWELVPGDSFGGQPYYRQRLPDPRITPESFTVLVGERWVATLATKEFAQIDFVRGLRAEMPPLLRPFVPYRLLWHLLMGESETYIGALAHETFHAYQGQVAAERLARAERVAAQEERYPWQDPGLAAAWQEEVNLLADAVRASSDVEATVLARRFLSRRDERRAQAGLAPALIDYERQREWLEGLAKYAELALGRAAARTVGYQPVPALAGDPEFRQYATREQFWAQQLDETRRLTGRSAETRFYYTGAAQAALLDRLMPGWQVRLIGGQEAPEDLLRQAVAADP